MTINTTRMLVMSLFALSLIATTMVEPAAWPLTAVGGFVVLVLAWAALGDGSVAAPVVGAIIIATLFMFGDGVAVGPLAACVIALAAGELLGALRATADQGTAVIRSVSLTRSATATTGIASAVIVVVMLVSLLPDHRVWSLAAVVAMVGLAVVTQRRRNAIADVPLPPPRAAR